MTKLIFRINEKQKDFILKTVPEYTNSLIFIKKEVLDNLPDFDLLITPETHKFLVFKIEKTGDGNLLNILNSKQTLENSICQGKVLYLIKIVKNRNFINFHLSFNPENPITDILLTVSYSEIEIEFVDPDDILRVDDQHNFTDYYESIIGIDEHPNLLVIATEKREFRLNNYSSSYKIY
jgi:hypothetical protein